jgi:hypothetical protein
MFNLTLIDHLRLTFGHVIYRHKAHSRIARSNALWSRWLKVTEALLMVGVGFASAGAAAGRGQAYAIASAALAGIAVATLFFHLAFDAEGSARAHASCATRLWQIREKYRALLSDLADGAIDLEAARSRRDGLMTELYGIYENAPPADARAYQAAAQALGTADEAVLTDEEIDVFLPRSLQKTGKSAAV